MSNMDSLDSQYRNLAHDQRGSFCDSINFLMTHGSLPSLVVAGNNTARLLYQGKQTTGKYDPTDPPSLLNHFSDKPISDLYNDSFGLQLFCGNGTARDSAVSPLAKDFAKELGSRCAEKNIGHVNGGAISGAMGAMLRAWVEAIDQLRNKSASTDPTAVPKIYTVILKLFGELEDREAPFEIDSYGGSSLKQLTWLTRVPALHGIGDQRAKGFLLGGAGTLLEGNVPNCAIQHQNQDELALIYGNTRRPARLFYLSDPGTHFWEPLANLNDRMTEAGVSSRNEQHRGMELFYVNDKHVIPEIINEYGPDKRGQIQRPALDDTQKELAVRALAIMNLGGLGPRLLPEQDHDFITILDNTIAAHTVLRHLNIYMDIFKRDGQIEAENYLESSVIEAAKERQECLKVLLKLSRKPALRLVGSTRESIWNDALELYSKEVITSAVNHEYSVVIDGTGTEGMAKRWSAMWVDAKQAFRNTHHRDSGSDLVRVQVALQDKQVPQRDLNGYNEVVLPTVLNFETRNEVAASVGSKQAIIVAPGGQTAVLTVAQAILNMQLLSSMHTPYREMPELHILNVPLTESSPGFYGDLLLQLRTMEQHGTISPGEYKESWFTTLERPIHEAATLLTSLRKSQ